jgi:dTDP-glucose 4,6-dehydratase
MKKVIVTGGSGFIGSNLVEFLIKKNFFVINIDKNTYTKNSNFFKYATKKNYIFHKFDINNSNSFFKVLKKHQPKAIFNLAAETHVDRSIDSPLNFVKSNILGVFSLLENVRKYKKQIKKNIKIIHVSTDEVYGDIKKNKRSNENSAYIPSSPYSATKASSDHLIKSYIRTYKIKAVISNCCNNYGPGQFPEKLIPTLIFNLIKNKPLPIYGKGINSREWIYVKDHCEALFQIYKKGKIGHSYNVGSGINLNNINLAKKLITLAKNKNINKKARITFVKDRPGHDLRYALDCKKIQIHLGWKSKTNLYDGLSKTFDWYINNRSFFNSFSKKLFYKRLGLKI